MDFNMLIGVVTLYNTFTSKGTSAFDLQESQYQVYGCYGIHSGNVFMDAECPIGSSIAVKAVFAGAKLITSGCERTTSGANFTFEDEEKCCKPVSSEDCIFTYTVVGGFIQHYKYHLHCTGRNKCDKIRIDTMDTPTDTCTDAYWDTSNFVYMDFYCIPDSSIGSFETTSLQIVDNSSALYIWNDGYPNTISPTVANNSCTVETSCGSTISLILIDLQLAYNATTGHCQQRLTIKDNATSVTLDCTSNNNFNIVETFTSTASFVYIFFTNELESDGGYVWIGVVSADGCGTLQVSCPAVEPTNTCSGDDTASCAHSASTLTPTVSTASGSTGSDTDLPTTVIYLSVNENSESIDWWVVLVCITGGATVIVILAISYFIYRKKKRRVKVVVPLGTEDSQHDNDARNGVDSSETCNIHKPHRLPAIASSSDEKTTASLPQHCKQSGTNNGHSSHNFDVHLDNSIDVCQTTNFTTSNENSTTQRVKKRRKKRPKHKKKTKDVDFSHCEAIQQTGLGHQSNVSGNNDEDKCDCGKEDDINKTSGFNIDSNFDQCQSYLHANNSILQNTLTDMTLTNMQSVNGNNTNMPADIGNNTNIPPNSENITNMPNDIGNNTNTPSDNGNNTHTLFEKGNNTNMPSDNGHKINMSVDNGHSTHMPSDKGNNTNLPFDKGNNINTSSYNGKNTNLLFDKENKTNTLFEKGNSTQIPSDNGINRNKPSDYNDDGDNESIDVIRLQDEQDSPHLDSPGDLLDGDLGSLYNRTRRRSSIRGPNGQILTAFESSSSLLRYSHPLLLTDTDNEYLSLPE